ncbi:DNase I-like protein [Coniochaeta sp. 2T2.1]|nr:DNase I-like protein [Coniochaeta sp. 2T2.1]
MTPASTLDLLFITFNCAKNLVNPGVFASHLHGALTQNANTGLPDLVVFSLQEVAPLSYSFMGPYFLSKYYTPYEEALNAAAARVLTTTTTPPTPDRPSTATAPYTLVKSNNIGMTSLLLFALHPGSISNLQDAVVGFGVQEMGNKGAVGCRFTYTSSSLDGKSTVLTFVATHLAAMEWNLKKRNANWRSIVSGLTFSNPKDALPGVFPALAPATTAERDQLGLGQRRPPSPASASSSEGSEEEDDDALPDRGDSSAPLLRQTSSSLSSSKKKNAVPPHSDLDPSHLSTLQELSIFAPATHLFLAGDLNYRISSTTPPPGSLFPSFSPDPSDPAHWSHFLARDQLTAERLAGRTLHGLSEAEITFGPSYKYDVLPDDEADTAAENLEGVRTAGEVPWKWAPHRWPSWCDRVLYLDLPDWVQRRRGPEEKIQTVAYDILPLMASSDHRPVFWRGTVPILPGEEMLPPSTSEGEDGGLEEEDRKDPRVTLPVAIDPHAWERRAAARRREVIAGWSMFLWATKEGAGVLGGGLLLGALTWWLWRVLG